MQVAGAFKGKRIANSVGKCVVHGVVPKFLSKGNLRSLSVFEFVGEARGGGDEISKVWVVRIIDEGNEYVRAEAGGRRAGRIIPVNDGRRLRLGFRLGFRFRV
jgi:hypothetical protein